ICKDRAQKRRRSSLDQSGGRRRGGTRGSRYRGHHMTDEKEAWLDIHILVAEPGQHHSCNMGCCE
ncbi:hypothetical protein HispidOSU_010427, partial [Sigmodon hispidus]